MRDLSTDTALTVVVVEKVALTALVELARHEVRYSFPEQLRNAIELAHPDSALAASRQAHTNEATPK